MFHVLYIDKCRWTQTQTHTNACRHRCTHANVNVSWHRGRMRMHADAHTDTHRWTQMQTDVARRMQRDCVQCVGRRSLKMCPEVGRLFKDFWDVLYIYVYRMARNFRGLKISRFSWINHEPRKFYPRKFYPSSHTYCAYAVRGATCQRMTFSCS